jgi:hypothetical protein
MRSTHARRLHLRTSFKVVRGLTLFAPFPPSNQPPHTRPYSSFSHTFHPPPPPTNADHRLVCRSDADNQLIVFIPFNTPVRLSGIILNGPEAERPTTVKLYANRAALGFEDVTDIEPTQELALKPEEFGDDAVAKLKVAKFTAVNSLFLFVECGEGETVALSKVGFVGTAVQGSSNMKDLKKQGEDEG